MAEKGKGKPWLPAVGNGRQKAASPPPSPDPDPAQLEPGGRLQVSPRRDEAVSP